ncbi:hypothetical protein [Apibacter adventoris]|uniref:Uncharacterized protein n=1 Tax=Apibacter adventoris TaxID=1679466 RepID=A0A2S8AEK2_9FLAO|nr:hypothetical protein [Apibacter adventoris]PQL93790.1 hypothetical protein C4S77_04360 [Apibacter adventoris]
MTNNDLGITKNHQSPMVNLQLSEERILFLESLYKSFRKGVYNSVPAKEYLAQRNLDTRQIEVGYNSGQFHHGEQKTRSLYTAP